MRPEHFVASARWIFGLFYAAVGFWIASSFVGIGSPPPQPTPAAAAFTSALTNSGIIDPLLALSYVIGGGALLFRRTTPFGIVLLAPSVVVIFFFHLVLSGQWVWGSLNIIWLAVLAWCFRSAFTVLWNYGRV
jgi:hypothetical protein